MSKTKIPYYKSDKISSEDAQYNLIYGERSNGKSYDIKHKYGLEYFVNKNPDLFKEGVENYNVLNITGRFVLTRREKEELKNERVESYFADCDIEKITNKKYNIIKVYRGEIYFAKYDINTGKDKLGVKIGYVIPLSLEQNYAGSSFLDVDNIIFEEFMSRKGYLRNEPTKLQNLYSTIDRKRGTTKVWMVGNTISRICPYLTSWGLIDLVKTNEQGTLFTKELEVGSDKDTNKKLYVKLAVEFCESTGVTSWAFGEHADMLNTGSWQTDKQPTLSDSFKNYSNIIQIGFDYMGFKYLGRLLIDSKDNLFWFICPHTKDKFKDNTIIFSDKINTNLMYQKNIYDITIPNVKLRKMLSDTFHESMIFFSDDLTGTEFKNAIDFVIRK